MKRHLLPMAVLLAACPLLFTSCSDDDEPDDPDVIVRETVSLKNADLAYGDDGVWADWNQNKNLTVGGYVFSHEVTMYGDYAYSTGYVASKSADTQKYDNMLDHQFTAMPGTGYSIDGTTGNPYMVAFWQSYSDGAVNSTAICREDGAEFQPAYVQVTNTTYAYYTMQYGNDFCRKFEKGDWFKLIAHGVHADDSETTAEFYLAQCTDEPEMYWLVSDWRKFDLTPLGQVKKVYFTMESSDSGEYGMNTPGYFAISDFTYIVEEN